MDNNDYVATQKAKNQQSGYDTFRVFSVIGSILTIIMGAIIFVQSVILFIGISGIKGEDKNTIILLNCIDLVSSIAFIILGCFAAASKKSTLETIFSKKGILISLICIHGLYLFFAYSASAFIQLLIGLVSIVSYGVALGFHKYYYNEPISIKIESTSINSRWINIITALYTLTYSVIFIISAVETLDGNSKYDKIDVIYIWLLLILFIIGSIANLLLLIFPLKINGRAYYSTKINIASAIVYIAIMLISLIFFKEFSLMSLFTVIWSFVGLAKSSY